MTPPDQVFPIAEEVLVEAFNALIDESDDPNYFVKLPDKIEKLTNSRLNNIVTKDDIVAIFPEMAKYSFPKIYIGFFSFSNRRSCESFINSISRLNNKFVITTVWHAIRSKAVGAFMDMRKLGVNIGFILLNKGKYDRRTIYHEWTHLFQTYVPEDRFFKIVENTVEYEEKIDKSLNKFGLSSDAAECYLFTKNEYITRLDNLIYMIHQTQKLEKYKSMTDFEFFDLFKETFSTDDPICLKSELFKDITSIRKEFEMDILFFIACYICYNETHEFSKICFEIENNM